MHRSKDSASIKVLPGSKLNLKLNISINNIRSSTKLGCATRRW